MSDKYTELLSAVVIGEMDDKLDKLQSALTERRKLVRQQASAQMKLALDKDTQVRFKDIRPKYLVGALAEVVDPGKRGRKVCVRMLESRGSWPIGAEANVPANCLELVKED